MWSFFLFSAFLFPILSPTSLFLSQRTSHKKDSVPVLLPLAFLWWNVLWEKAGDRKGKRQGKIKKIIYFPLWRAFFAPALTLPSWHKKKRKNKIIIIFLFFSFYGRKGEGRRGRRNRKNKMPFLFPLACSAEGYIGWAVAKRKELVDFYLF